MSACKINVVHQFVRLSVSVVRMSLTTEEEIRRTLRSINQTAAETEKISAATAAVINAQGEQINNIAKNADKIEENLNTSEWIIRGLKGWGGRIANSFSGPSKTVDSAAEKYPSYMPREAVRPMSQNVANSVNGQQTVNETYRKSDFDQEVDQQLDHISNVLGGIHARSLEISDSISRQVKTVEAVDRSMDRSHDRMRKQHEDIKRLR